MTLNLLNNTDHGVLPAGSIVIKEDLGLDNLQYGMIGSAVFAGLTIGKSLLLYSDHSSCRLYRCYFRLPAYQHLDSPLHCVDFRGHLTRDVLLLLKLLLVAVHKISDRFLPSIHFDLLPGVGRHFWGQ
jgi:hypothetical protein